MCAGPSGSHPFAKGARDGAPAHLGPFKENKGESASFGLGGKGLHRWVGRRVGICSRLLLREARKGIAGRFWG